MGKDKGKPTYYIDSSVFIELIEDKLHTNEVARCLASIIGDAKTGRFDLVTSTLTIAEVWYAKSEIDGKAIDQETEKTISLLWHPGTSPIRTVEVSELIAKDSLALLRNGIANGWSKTKGGDGIHLATAQREEADEFFTTELSAYKWGHICGFQVCAPHYEPPPPPPKRKPPDPLLFENPSTESSGST